jgi:pimeloyl-ACP methyl ester carboxylesterase
MKKRYWIAGASGLAGGALAVKLLARPHDVDWAAHAGQLHHADCSRFAAVDGARLHYQEAGPAGGPPVLLIHGFCSSTFVWSDVLLPLAARNLRVIALDLMGFGFSAKPRNGEYTIEGQARLIVRLLDQLGIERATLAGSSYGGAVAAACALDHPERVERLILVGAVTNNEAKRQPLARLAMVPVVGDLFSPLLLGSRWFTRWRISKGYKENGARLIAKRMMSPHQLPLRTANMHRAALLTLRRWDAERIGRAAHLINQPTLLIWGEKDHEVPLRHGEQLLKSMPCARLVVFRRCGHLPQEERPQEFTEVVAEFCKESPGRKDMQGKHGVMQSAEREAAQEE